MAKSPPPVAGRHTGTHLPGWSAAAMRLVRGDELGPLRFDARLAALCADVLEQAADPDQHLSLSVAVDGAVPASEQAFVLFLGRELVASAVANGFYLRLIGTVRVEVAAAPDRLGLTVADDGWTVARAACLADMRSVRLLRARPGATIEVTQHEGRTMAVATWPAWAS